NGLRDLGSKSEDRFQARHRVDAHSQIDHDEIRICTEVHSTSFNPCHGSSLLRSIRVRVWVCTFAIAHPPSRGGSTPRIAGTSTIRREPAGGGSSTARRSASIICGNV